MKKQTRPAEPDVLKKKSAEWNKQWKDLRERNPNASFSWYAHEGRSAREWILPTLRRMNQEHCSFCDGFPLVGLANEPIEHFRPKSDHRFYDQSYSWGNLYFCCNTCNETKGESWDDRLLAPDEETYEFEDFFAYDYTTGGLMVNPNASAENQDRACTTIKLYGLDTDDKRRLRRLADRIWKRMKDPSPSDLDDQGFRNFIVGV